MHGHVQGSVIFVGGIHGTGKSSIGASVAATLGVRFHSAGQLIREARNDRTSTLEVSEVGANQELLLKQLARLQRDLRPILLDGHYCLLTPGNSIQPIPVSVFEAIRPIGLAVLVDEPSVIYERLLARDGACPRLETLEQLQSLEVEHSRKVAKALGKEIHILDAAREEELRTLVWTLVQSCNAA